MDYSSWKTVLEQERLPCVVVDLDAFDRNAKKLVEAITGTHLKLRIATKSIRVPALLRRLLNQGDPIKGLMTFSAEETRFLADQGFDDFLLAYPTVQRQGFEHVREIHEQGKKVRMVLDSFEGLSLANRYFSGVSKPLEIVLEMDVALRVARQHLGVRRSPIRTVDELILLIKKSAALKNVVVSSIMIYESQIAGVGDQNPFKKTLNPAVKAVRAISIKQVAHLRKKIVFELEKNGLKIDLFNGGGTGSLAYCADEPWLTEVTAGSGFLCPHLFDYYSNLNLEPACFFALQACRQPESGFVTCQGGGYIASGEPGWDKVPIVHLPPGELVPAEGCGEAQTPIKLQESDSVRLGDPVFFRHAKAGELAERFSEYLLVSSKDQKICERAKTYRGYGECYF